LSAACKIAVRTPFCGEVQKAIGIALGNLKRKVGGMFLELWEEKPMPTAKGVLAVEEQGACLRALESCSDIGFTVLNVIFEPSSGDLPKDLEECVNMVRPNHLSSWRLENPSCAKPGGMYFPSPPTTGVDTLFTSAFARLVYVEWSGIVVRSGTPRGLHFCIGDSSILQLARLDAWLSTK
jgi:hypothetical protein